MLLVYIYIYLSQRQIDTYLSLKSLKKMERSKLEKADLKLTKVYI